MNYFELLNIEKKYDIDFKILDKEYFIMQLKYHPDKAKNTEEQQKNLTTSIDLNKAYTTLKDDLARAEYLLFLNNIDFNDIMIRQRISTEQLNSIWNELELVESISSLPSLEQLHHQKIFQQKQIVSSLTMYFKKQNFQEALDTTIKLKYLKNLIDKLQVKIKSCK